MLDYDTASFSKSQSLSALFDWKPDLERFEREVREAQLKGEGDGLALAEMECSLDLVDAELLSLRGSSRRDEQAAQSIKRLEDLRAKLERLVRRMRPLATQC